MGLDCRGRGGRVRKRPGYLFKYSRRGVRVIVGSHMYVHVCTQVSLRFFRGCIASFPVSMHRVPRSRGGVHRRRALFVRGRAHVRTFARVSLAFSLSLSFFPLSSRIRRVAAFFSLDFPLLDQLRSRGLSSRVSSARIKDYIRAGCLAHIGACVVRTSAERKERKNSKSKAPRGLVIHRRSAPAVRRHYLRVSRHSELLIRPRCRW